MEQSKLLHLTDVDTQLKQVTIKTQAGICQPGGLTITRTGRQPVSLIHQLSSLQQRPEQEGGVSIYTSHIQVAVLQTATPPLLSGLFRLKIDLLHCCCCCCCHPLNQSVCIHLSINLPALLARLPASVPSLSDCISM